MKRRIAMATLKAPSGAARFREDRLAQRRKVRKGRRGNKGLSLRISLRALRTWRLCANPCLCHEIISHHPRRRSTGSERLAQPRPAFNESMSP